MRVGVRLTLFDVGFKCQTGAFNDDLGGELFSYDRDEK
jgi:hypothetical protein